MSDQYRDVEEVYVKSDASILLVEILDDGTEGNRETDVPSIALMQSEQWEVMLTWQEAEEVAAALNKITGIARNG